MNRTLPLAASSRIVVVGDVMVDRYWYGDAHRISQEAPVPVVDVAVAEDRPGGAANVALNVVAMGAACTLVSAVGNDEAARGMRATLEGAGVLCDFVEVADWETTLKLRVLSRRQQLIRLDFERRPPAPVADRILVALERHVAAAEALIIEDYDKGVVDAPEGIVAAAKKAGMTVVVDPKFKDLGRYAGADIIKPNRAEFEHAVGVWADEGDLARRADELLDRIDGAALVVTLGGAGLTVIERGGASHRVQASNVEIYDVTGAGDTVAAALGVAASLGWSVMDGARMANLAAGLVCARIGTAAVTAAEVNRSIARQPSVEHGVLDREALIAAVAAARGRGDKIVFTNGCFDILHAGHVGYLDQARGLGDRLVIAVNDNASAERLKGNGRPVNDVESRMRVLDGLASVDWVTSFSEDTPETLLSALRPDVLAKGGDYAESEVVGGDFVRGYGGTVKVLGLFEDSSTTSIIDRIKSD